MVDGEVPVGHTAYSWESQGATVPVGHTLFSWTGSSARKLPRRDAESRMHNTEDYPIEEHGPHGHEPGGRVQIQGLRAKPHLNGSKGTVERLLDPFGMGRICVRIDSTGNELSVKDSSAAPVCALCDAGDDVRV